MSINGLLVLDKPAGITSRAAVDRALRWFPRRTRMGHAGTLDPLATGVLVLCLGNATRLVEYVQQMSKTYHSLFRLGARSDTDDADGVVTEVADAVDPGKQAVRDALKGFLGAVEQTPPAFSAAKVTGQRAYALARRGQEVTLRPRQVEIREVDLLSYQYPEVEVVIRCGKGTYIRSIARDLGEQLGCGALVQTLRRTSIGPFTVEQAVRLEADRAEVQQQLLPAGLAVADLPKLVLAEPDRERLRNGQALPLPEALKAGNAEEVAVFDDAGTLTSVCVIDGEQHLLRPAKVFG